MPTNAAAHSYAVAAQQQFGPNLVPERVAAFTAGWNAGFHEGFEECRNRVSYLIPPLPIRDKQWDDFIYAFYNVENPMVPQ
jgi:hypothetical protein